MTQRQVATLACRILAIWALIDAIDEFRRPIDALSSAIIFLQRGMQVNMWGSLLMLIPLAVQLAVAIWLWRKSPVVAIWMTGESLQDDPSEPEHAPQRASFDQVQAVVLSSLGVWLLLLAVPHIGSTGFEFLLAYLIERSLSAPGRGFTTASYVVTNSIWIWAFQLLLGLWLIFGAKGIARLLQRARGERLTPKQP